MKIYLFAAMSLDGFIATNEYSEDFLGDEHWNEFTSLCENKGCFIVSRKVYELVNKWEEKYSLNNINAKKIIVSKNPNFKLKNGYLLAFSPTDALNIAKKNKFNEVVVAGGGQLNSAFLDNNLVDELVLTIESCLIGKGISFFSNKSFKKKLKLIAVKKINSDVVRLHYEVIK